MLRNRLLSIVIAKDSFDSISEIMCAICPLKVNANPNPRPVDAFIPVGRLNAHPKTNNLGKSEKIGKFQRASKRQELLKVRFSVRLGIRARPDLRQWAQIVQIHSPIWWRLRSLVKRLIGLTACSVVQHNLHNPEERHHRQVGWILLATRSWLTVLSVLMIPTEPRLRCVVGPNEGFNGLAGSATRDAT
jgi:hypothetical protein